MSEQTIDAAGLVRMLVESIVDNPDDLNVVQSEEGGGDILVEISVNEEDAGKVIGRQGRVIKAIRTLARAAAMRSGKHVDVEIVD
ncbi:KH domain-containing protein [Curtanaerobium respiraculi]|uniref:KH domain-containing protein n=1 Tax=Curtanaerobium respiraculi TaxID=2949669 RepID=UPI0024B3B886|nr:KH domain-containing protein [Curtanaerobium respiraculi]